MSGEATVSAENSGKPLGGLGYAPNPAGGAHNTPPGPLAGGEGACCPFPKNPTFGLDFPPFGLAPPMKIPGHAPVHKWGTAVTVVERRPVGPGIMEQYTKPKKIINTHRPVLCGDDLPPLLGFLRHNIITTSFNEWLVSRKPCTSMHTVVKIR